MKHYYNLTDGKPALVSGQISKPDGFTEYDPDNPPAELLDAQKDDRVEGVSTIAVPSKLLIPVSLGGEALDDGLVRMLSLAVSMGAKVVTHPAGGLTCVTVYDSFLAGLPDVVRQQVNEFIVDKKSE